MATTTFLANADVTIGGTDVSDQVSAVSLTVGYDELSATSMGDTGHKFVKGLQTVELTLTLFNSYGASEVEATLQALVGDGDTTIVVMPTGTGPAVDSPAYTITNAMLSSFTPINSTVGELSTVDVTFTGGTWARATA